ncbi:MAG: HigA family addiction module antitoxin [Bryobacteraceae bacterium]|jgi:addiction module HigA family antidote
MAQIVKNRPPVHPGRSLKMILDDAQLTANAVALALRIPANRLTEIINGKRSISADTAMRLGRYFGTSAQMWMNLQSRYDIATAEAKLAERIASEVQPYQRTA